MSEYPSSVPIELKNYWPRIRAGEDFNNLHDQRMNKEDWEVFGRMTKNQRQEFESVIGQLRTGVSKVYQRDHLEARRLEILNSVK